MVSISPQFLSELERHLQAKTGHRVRDLAIEVRPEQVILRGHASSYHVKQLAQQSIRELLPEISLHNEIVVDEKTAPDFISALGMEAGES